MPDKSPDKTSILLAFLGNFNFDSRMYNFYSSLKKQGYSVSVVSFDWLTEGFNTERGEVSIYKLTKGRFSLFFYLQFAIILLYRLLKSNANMFFAEDIYTLPFVLFAAKLKNIPVVYDSREVYSQLAGLVNKQHIQRLIVLIEKFCIRKVNLTMTTGHMDSAHIEKQYGIPPTFVMRNLPQYADNIVPFNFRAHFNITADKTLLLYQGAVLHGRGLKIILPLLPSLPDCVLIVVGWGEQSGYYQAESAKLGLQQQVFFCGKVPQTELLQYTAGADIGLSIIENLSTSYYYALPNKMFEYIQAGVPSIASNFPQMQEIVDTYRTGLCVNPEDNGQITASILQLITDKEQYGVIKENCRTAARELSWENEFAKLLPILQQILLTNK
ncbi:MAG: glycosyltransferase [Ignavibacteriales bacterium]|nr:glycosyltransferase [Ignavibacteriales bacterium]